MARKKNRMIEHDDGTYKSSSSIDSPPVDERDEGEESGEQETLFGEGNDVEETKEFLDGPASERNFGVELKLVLKPGGDGKAIQIPLLAGEWAGSRVLELLALSINSRRNKKIIEAVLDLPEVLKEGKSLVNGEVKKEERESRNYTEPKVPEFEGLSDGL